MNTRTRLFSHGFALLALSLGTILPAAEPLPEYTPAIQVTGVLRGCGNPQMAALLRRWQAGFQRFHPGVQFADDLKSSASGMYGLDMRTADFRADGPRDFPVRALRRLRTFVGLSGGTRSGDGQRDRAAQVAGLCDLRPSE
jgi:hypothetical protein